MDAEETRLTKWKVRISDLAPSAIAGVVAAAVWQSVGEPIFYRLRNIALSILTFGLDELKDNVYLDVARGFHEHTAASALLLLLPMFAIGGLWLLGVTYAVIRVNERNTLGTAAGRSRSEQALLWLVGHPDNMRRGYRRARVCMRILTVLLAIYSAPLITRLSIGLYTVAANTYYQQMRATVAPHVDNTALLTYDATLANVRTRADYVALMSALEAEARKHTSTVPEFSIW